LSEDLVLVKAVYGEVIKRDLMYNGAVITVLDTRITCILENDKYFYLERVPPEIVYSLKRLNGEDLQDDRERLIDILLSMPEVIDSLGKHLKRVIINEFDEETGVYSAIAEFEDNGVKFKRKMVPSHAILLARLTNRPIFVKRQLIEQQEAMYKLLGEEGFSDINEYDEHEGFDELDEV